MSDSELPSAYDILDGERLVEGGEIRPFSDHLWAFSKNEHESLSSFDALIAGYRTAITPKRPLCLAVFGAPGCY